MKNLNQLALILIILLIASCSNVAVDRDDTFPLITLDDRRLTVKLQNPIPDGFSIQSPEKKWFYIVVLSEEINHIGDSYISGEFSMDLSTFKATHWDNVERSESLVFSSSGEYLLYFADNLETEPENTVHNKKSIFVTVP